MGITIKEGYRETTAESSLSGGKKYKQVFVITNTSTTDGMEKFILDALPSVGDAYAYDSTATASKVSVEMTVDANYFQWEGTVEYEQADYDSGTSGGTDGGFETDLVVSTDSQQYEKVLELAYDDDNELTIPVVSTTGEALVVPYYYSNTIIDISYNVSFFDFNWSAEFENTTTDSDVSICGIQADAEKARMLKVGAVNRTDSNGDTYYNVSIKIEITREDFLEKHMNKGFRKLKEGYSQGDERFVYILKSDVSEEDDEDIKNERIDEPAKLGASGADNAPDATHDISEPIKGLGADYLQFRSIRTKDWSTLDIPESQPE